MKSSLQRTVYALAIICSVVLTGCHDAIATQAQTSFAAFLTAVATTLINAALVPQ